MTGLIILGTVLIYFVIGTLLCKAIYKLDISTFRREMRNDGIFLFVLMWPVVFIMALLAFIASLFNGSISRWITK